MSACDRLPMGPGYLPRRGEEPESLVYGDGYRDINRACHIWLMKHDPSYRREQQWRAAHRPKGKEMKINE